MENGELPEGWAFTTLGSIVAPSKEKIEPSECPDVPYIGLEHLEAHSTRILGHGLARSTNSTKTVFRRDDVLYGKLRPYLNKVAIADTDGVCSTDILVFPQSKDLESRFLMRFLNGHDVMRYADHHSTGVQLPRVSWEALAELPVPLPPLAEQRRIVEALDGLLERVNGAR